MLKKMNDEMNNKNVEKQGLAGQWCSLGHIMHIQHIAHIQQYQSWAALMIFIQKIVYFWHLKKNM